MASDAAVTSPIPPPAELGAPALLPPDGGAPAVRAWVPPRAADGGASGHIALLLPLNSSAFGKHAEAVINGFHAAARVQGSAALPIRVYATGDDPRQVVEIYSQALANGARLVVGPLTRSGITALVERAVIIVPTLALNALEGGPSPPRELFTLSLQAETEARQVAQLAHREGRRNALIVTGDAPLMKRIHQAFAEEFTRLGGELVAEFAFTNDPEGLVRTREAAGLGIADMAFMALDVQRARLARPYLDPLAIYATSQVYPAGAGPLAYFDLAGVRFLDMPWLLQPDHPAVMIYPRPEFRDGLELERFYALGIDAFRIGQELLVGDIRNTLDGVTGRITLGQDQQFTRVLTTAQFRDGRLTVVGEKP